MRALLYVALAAALASPAGAATRNFTVTNFTKIRVDGPFNVSLKTGVAPFAKASGSSDAIDRVAIDVRGDTLVIRSSLDSWGGYPGKDAGPVEISLGTHDLSGAAVNGSGALSIDKVRGLSFNLTVQGSAIADIDSVDVDQFRVDLAGSVGATLGGKAGKLTSVLRGLSTLDATKLDVKDVSISADGPGTVKAQVSNSASIDASGPATIRLDGKPACTLKVVGSASVSGCGSNSAQ
jgi:hypothetical protein